MNDPPLSVKAIFDHAHEIGSSAERRAYLDQACENAPAVRRKVEDLLQAYDEAGSFMQSPAELPPTGDLTPIAEGPGSRIGPYKLLQQIGEGGMGVVYMAEQERPVRRRIALKIIKPGMDSAQVIARFESERQALAMMDHPNIAKVLDAGTTGANDERGTINDEGKQSPDSGSSFIVHRSSFRGRPYFVMELVKGVPITKYCDDNHLTPKERLALFVPVCQAIQHAHQKGVIHRDIKPSNVLVTLYDGHPVPKVIDFGVAKAIEQRLTERTLFTQYGQIVGTLEYMSPEQAEMNALDVDTRSDIYSLGVLLYELLTGSTPIEQKRVRSAGFDEIRRIIREEDPPKPSMRLSGSGEALAAISAQRKTEPAKLTRLVKGELDWIVMKALEKDRGRRYETASEFAADVGRYLRDEPVLASPPGLAYQLRKVYRRHRGPVLAAAAVMLTLLVGVIATGVMALLADQERRRAQAAATDAEQKSQELQTADQVKTEALHERTQALKAKTAALGRTKALLLSSRALLLKGENPEVAGALAIEAARLSPEKLTRRTLLSALEEMPTAYRELEVPVTEWGPAALAPWIRYTPSSREVIGVDERGDFHVWDAANGKRLRGFTGVGGNIRTIVLAPDGKRVAAIDERGRLQVFKFETGETERILEPPPGQQFQQMAFSPESNRLAAACGVGLGATDAAGRVCLWTLDPFVETVLFEGKESFYSVNFSMDGKKLSASSQGKRRLLVWDLDTKRVLLDDEHADGLPWPTVIFTPDGKKILDVGRQGIHVWDLDQPAARRHLENSGYQGDCYLHEFSDSAGVLVTSSMFKGWLTHVLDDYGPVQLWDTRDLKLKQTFGSPTRRATHVAMTADGRFVAIVMNKRDVEIWNTSTGNLEARLRCRIPVETFRFTQRGGLDDSMTAIALRPDGKSLVIVHKSGVGTLCDAEDRGALPVFPRAEVDFTCVNATEYPSVLRAHEGIAVLDPRSLRIRNRVPYKGIELTGWRLDRRSLAHSPETDRFAAFVSNSKVAVLEGSTGKSVVELERALKAYAQASDEIFFVAGGRRLLIRYTSREVELIDSVTGNTIQKIKGARGSESWARRTFQLSPDRRRLFLDVDKQESGEREFHILDTESDQRACKLQLRGVDAACAAVFSPDGRKLATVFEKRSKDQDFRQLRDVVIWNAETGERIAVLPGPAVVRISAVVFAPDGKTLLTGDSKGVVRRWDIETKSELFSFNAHKGVITDVTIDGTGSKIATLGDADLDAAVWDTKTGNELLRLSGLEFGEFRAVRFAADDKVLLTVSSDGVLRSWPLDPVKHMDERGYRKLTPEERRQFELDER